MGPELQTYNDDIETNYWVKDLAIFYDAFVWVLDNELFFSKTNDIPEFRFKAAELSPKILDFHCFIKSYGVIKKWAMYYIVKSPEYAWKFTDTFDFFNEDMVEMEFSALELRKFQTGLLDINININIQRAVDALLRLDIKKS